MGGGGCYAPEIGQQFDLRRVDNFVIDMMTLSLLNLFSYFSFAVYTFEDATHLTAFSALTSTLALSTTRFKDGANSMKWTWASGDEITHSISVCFTKKFISYSKQLQ